MTVPNLAPSANAGPDVQLVLTSPNQAFVLDGSRSRDADGSIVAFRWRQVNGPGATIVNPSVAQTPVTVQGPGTYQFELTVTDNRGTTSRDTMQATITARPNQGPVANAGADVAVQLVGSSASVVLNGAQSSDPDGAIVGIAWRQVAGPTPAVIVSPGSAQTSVQLSAAGVYQFELTVTDDRGAIARDSVSVTVTTASSPCGPTARAGRDVMLLLPANATVLDGSASSSADGTIIAYAWEQVAGPAAGCASGHESARLTLTGLARGSYRFRLTVMDSRGRSASDEANVAVGRAGG